MIFGPLEFLPVNLNFHEDLCLQFAADAILESFGSYDRFHEEDGKGSKRYKDWLKERLTSDPTCSVLVRFESKIIGQVTTGTWKPDPSIGYVNLYYLIPGMRDRGFGDFLERYAVQHLKGFGFSSARLSVSPTNPRALRFYQRNGWRDLGPRPGLEHVNLMEKYL